MRQSFAHRLGLRHWSLVHVDGIHLKMFVNCCDVIHYHMPLTIESPVLPNCLSFNIAACYLNIYQSEKYRRPYNNQSR